MKRTVSLPIVFLSALLFFLLFTSSAMADKPTDPYFDLAYAMLQNDVSAASDSFTVTIDNVLELYEFDTEYPISVTVEGGTAPYRYTYYLYSFDRDPLFTPDSASYEIEEVIKSDSSVFNFSVDFPYSWYYLLVQVTDADGETSSTQRVLSVPAPDADHPSYRTQVEQIAASNPKTTLFDKVLWLYNKVLAAGDYDSDYVHHGAGCLLVEGTGVCDSYSKLFRDLLIASGIESFRLTGGNHAWVAAKLDGNWYAFDPTWDDDASIPYLYFGLTIDLMNLDHTLKTYESHAAVSGSALDYNYYFHYGVDKIYGGNDAGSTAVDMICNAVADKTNGMSLLEIPAQIPVGDGWYMDCQDCPMIYRLIAAYYNMYPRQINGRTYLMGIIYSENSADPKYTYRLSFADITAGGQLQLPTEVTAIHSQSFAGTAACELIITGPLDILAADAFENSALTLITLEGEDALLPEEIALDMTQITVRCDQTNPYWDVATQNDYPVIAR